MVPLVRMVPVSFWSRLKYLNDALTFSPLPVCATSYAYMHIKVSEYWCAWKRTTCFFYWIILTSGMQKIVMKFGTCWWPDEFYCLKTESINHLHWHIMRKNNIFIFLLLILMCNKTKQGFCGISESKKSDSRMIPSPVVLIVYSGWLNKMSCLTTHCL